MFFTQSVAHNPTGSELAAGKAYRVLQRAQKHDLLIVENDPLADFKSASMPRLAAFDQFDQLDRTIYIGTFSKSFSAALRVGFIACDADLASDLADLKALVHGSSSEYCKRTVDVILSEGHYQRHVGRLRQRLGAATDNAVQLFESMGAKVFARTPQSLYLWATSSPCRRFVAAHTGPVAPEGRPCSGEDLLPGLGRGVAMVEVQCRCGR